MMHTQLVISASGSNATRMSVAATQANEQFQGMKNLLLIPFFKNGINENPITATDNILNTGQALENLESFQFTSNSRLYDISLPYGTNALLVYGRSMATTTGELTANWDNFSPANITFSPVQIVSNVTNIGTETNPVSGAAGEKGNAIIAYLNSIFNQNWANATTYPVLNNYYDMVKDMKAGSSASVIAFVQEVYDALKSSTAAGVSDVLAAITNTEYVTVTDGAITFNDDYQGYPADINLPDGTAAIEWVEGEGNYKFRAVTNQNNLGAMNVDVTKFVKPADLWYRTNSRINTDNESRLTDYQTQTTWTGVLNTYAEQNGSVRATTKSVAVRQQMQYAVGRLDVKLATTQTTLKDKENNEFAPADLPIKGILVGQQRPVDFKFEPTNGDSYTIYDSEIASAINATDFTHTLVLETPAEETVNVAIELLNNDTDKRSIVLDTKVMGEEEEVTMEKQIVPYGCKFYLIGQLDYTKANVQPTHKKVFVQDEVTEVTFTVNDLTKGYYVIPPLSSAELVFSLGVKDWKLSSPSSTILK